MCGRYALYATPDEVARLFRLSLDEVRRVFDLSPRYNIAPTDAVPGIRCGRDDNREAAVFRWGLIPHWAHSSDFGARTINARAETVADKPTFRDSFRQRRCLIPASGFYEWQKVPGGKQPYFFRMRGDTLFALAGLWDRWGGLKAGASSIESCAVITTSPNTLTRPVHDRMPVIIEPGDFDDWLCPGPLDRALARQLLGTYPPERMTGYPVSPLVSRPGNEGVDLVEPVGASLDAPLELDL
jgi:putative SOS response-associated peptidase YedK